MPVITFDHVDVVFGPNPESALQMMDQNHNRDQIFKATQNLVAVHDACLEVSEGQICVLMGLSGSGKSSLLRCVNGLNKVTRGRVLVRVDGEYVDVTRCGRKKLHTLRTDHISMVFQQVALMPWRTVRDNVAFGLDLAGVAKPERDRIVDENLALVRLSKWADKYPHQLSGGMQQRVGLARALATDASILLMDEPFSALDPLIREHLQDELIQIQDELKKTILFVSHDLNEALKLGSFIAIMEAGRIVQSGYPEDIVTHPANEYVRRFVASMNPLKVLRCDSVLLPLSRLETVSGDSGAIRLDPDGYYRLSFDADGRPDVATASGDPVHLVPFRESFTDSGYPDDALVVIGSETPLRIAVEVYYATGKPMIVIDTDKKVAGVVGIREILKSILQKTGADSRFQTHGPETGPDASGDSSLMDS